MSDLISRQAILKHIEKIRQGALMMDDMRMASIIMNGMHLCEEAVRNQPSVQSKRLQGHWRVTPMACYGGGTVTEYECSECEVHQITVSNFCPNCGADMRGEQNGRDS